MAHPSKIGVACPIPGERAAFLEWLTAAGFEPIPMLDLDSLARDLNARPIEALIADIRLVKGELSRLTRILGSNRPLIVVGEPGSALESVPRDATWLDRPVAKDNLLLSMQLALAEGRPARRSPRKTVGKVLSTVDGVAANIVDLSAEGLRLEFSGPTPPTLGPYFTLQVPAFGVMTKVKRVWVAAPPQGQASVGGLVEKVLTKKNSWEYFLETAPSTAQITYADTRGYL